jgi:tetratricopeptide (TPR) repeat protein
LKLRTTLLLFTLLNAGCTFSFQGWQFRQAKSALSDKRYESAVKGFEKVIANDPNSALSLKAAELGAPVAHLQAKDYEAAVGFYRHIIYKGPTAEERMAAQKAIAQIYFENLHDYDQAILEYESLLRLKLPDEEAFKYRLNVVKSQLELNNLDQAFSEVDALITQFPKGDLYEAKVLKANINISNKHYGDAATILEDVLKEFPDRAKKENLHLSLVVCYEDIREFAKAIQVLESMRSWYNHTDFLDLRIKRLKERSSNQPGAQGWKR